MGKALIEGEHIGHVSSCSNRHLHMTLESKGPRCLQFEIEFDRFALTPWPVKKSKRSLCTRFVCGWATEGFDSIGHSLSTPEEHLSPLAEVPPEPVFVAEDDGTTVQCCSCHQRLLQRSFTRTQLRKCASKRRCSKCTQ